MVTNTKLRVVFPRWPTIGFKTSSYQTTSCSIESYFSDQWCLHVCCWMSNPVIYKSSGSYYIWFVQTSDVWPQLAIGHKHPSSLHSTTFSRRKKYLIINKYLIILETLRAFLSQKINFLLAKLYTGLSLDVHIFSITFKFIIVIVKVTINRVKFWLINSYFYQCSEWK